MKSIDSVLILGAGTMGREIAALNLTLGVHVTLYDQDSAVLKTAETAIVDRIQSFGRPAAAADLPLTLASALNSTISQPLVIETVTEKPRVKQKLLKTVETRLAAPCWMATNTSTIPIQRLAPCLHRPDRFCGIHFLMPVLESALVEIVPGSQTSAAVLQAARNYARQLGKSIQVVGDQPGFLINRMLGILLGQAIKLLEMGETISRIDQIAVRFGMEFGPFGILDLIGLDTATDVGASLYFAFPDRMSPSSILPTLVNHHRLGRKAGRGFYQYSTPTGPPIDDEAVPPMIQRHVKPLPNSLADSQIEHHLFLPMVLEAGRILEDQVVQTPDEIDEAMRLGLRLQPGGQGLLRWAVGFPIDQIVKRWDSSRIAGPSTVQWQAVVSKLRSFYDSLQEGHPRGIRAAHQQHEEDLT